MVSEELGGQSPVLTVRTLRRSGRGIGLLDYVSGKSVKGLM
jgi:hypothetical protein